MTFLIGPPTEVEVTMYILSVSDMSDTNMVSRVSPIAINCKMCEFSGLYDWFLFPRVLERSSISFH